MSINSTKCPKCGILQKSVRLRCSPNFLLRTLSILTTHAASEGVHAIVRRMSECTHRQTAGHVLLRSVKLLAGRGHILMAVGRGGGGSVFFACMRPGLCHLYFFKKGPGVVVEKEKVK